MNEAVVIPVKVALLAIAAYIAVQAMKHAKNLEFEFFGNKVKVTNPN